MDYYQTSGSARLSGESDCEARGALLVDAQEHNTSDPEKLIPAYALLSRIRLSSSSSVLNSAEEAIRMIVTAYPQPNLTTEQIQFRALNGEDLRIKNEVPRPVSSKK